jgi:hypothetical protein
MWRELLESPDVQFMQMQNDKLVPDRDATEVVVKANVINTPRSSP